MVSVQAHFIRPAMPEQPVPAPADSLDVISVIIGVRLVIIFADQAPIRTVEACLLMALSQVVVEHDRTGDREVERRHQTPLRNPDHQLRLVEKL